MREPIARHPELGVRTTAIDDARLIQALGPARVGEAARPVPALAVLTVAERPLRLASLPRRRLRRGGARSDLPADGGDAGTHDLRYREPDAGRAGPQQRVGPREPGVGRVE